MPGSGSLKWAFLAVAATLIGAPLGVWFATAQVPELLAPPVPLRAPTLLTPADGATTPLAPVLTWTGDRHGGAFILELSGDPTFPPDLTERHLVESEHFARDEAYAPGVRMHWRVRVLSGDLASGPWSPTWSFVPSPLA